MIEEVVSLPRMARRLQVTQVWLREKAESGLIPHLPAGRRLLFNPDAVQKALAQEAAKSPAGLAADSPEQEEAPA